ncbi:MAG: hypothetical protein ACLPH5_14510 [Candidatus Sulfotelmatobacter sp.]
MRTVAAVLVSVLLGMTRPATATDKIKIEIIEATATIGLIPRASPGTPEQIRTHCDTHVDVNCVSTVTPATEPSSALLPQVLVYTAKAILPDGSHATLTCFPSRWEKKCKWVESASSTGAYSDDVNGRFQRDVNGHSGHVNKVGAQRRWDYNHARHLRD